MAADSSDQELVRRAKDGDARAFEELISRHQRKVYALIGRMISTAEVAEELSQDVFMKAYRGLAGFRDEAAFSTWVYRIAVNCVRDYVDSRASRNRERETSLGETGGHRQEPASSMPGPDDTLRETRLAADFADIVESLDFHLKEAFLLRHQESLEYEQIAEILGITRSNAKVRVHRARNRILKLLRRRGYEL